MGSQMYAEPRNPSDIKHVDGCHGTAGCRCAHYETLNPRESLPPDLRQRVRAIDSYYDDPCKACGEKNCEASDTRCCSKCEHGGACEGCGLPRHPARALGSACRRCGHRMGDGCTSRSDAGDVLKVGDVVRALFSAGLIDKGRKFRIGRVHPDGRIGFVGLEPLLGSPRGYALVPPQPDPGLPADYAADALPPGWEKIEVPYAHNGVGYKRTRGKWDRRYIYEQHGGKHGWVISGSRWFAPNGLPLHEVMRRALGLDWIGELWTDPDAPGRPNG